MSKKRKIPMKNFKSDLALIFKNRFDKLGYSTWKDFTDELGIENKRTFVDFFMGKQYVSKDILVKAFNKLEIPIELLDLYVEPIIKYKIKD